jgi:hypothetical protein
MFIYWLATAFILAAIFIVRREKEHQFAFRLFISVIAFFAVLNLINPDALIARHNISRLNATGKIDAYSLTNLSEDATPALVGLLTSTAKNGRSDVNVNEIIANKLYTQRSILFCSKKHWQSANISKMQAKHALSSNMNKIETAKSHFVFTNCADDHFPIR